jgi:hypothetical protein
MILRAWAWNITNRNLLVSLSLKTSLPVPSNAARNKCSWGLPSRTNTGAWNLDNASAAST